MFRVGQQLLKGPKTHNELGSAYIHTPQCLEWTVHRPLKSNYSGPECGRKRHKRLISWPLQGKSNNRALTFLNVHGNFELTFRWLFPRLSRGNSQVTHHQPPPHLATHDLLRLLPTTTLKSKHFFLMDYAPISDLALLHLLLPASSTANVNSFKTICIFLLQAVCIEEPCQPQDCRQVVFSIQSWCWWVRLRSPGLDPFLFCLSNVPYYIWFYISTVLSEV